jgi:integrase
MGRTGQSQGVDVRETSIRITFTLDGKQRRETLMVEGVPMAPTPPNIKYATRLAAEIRDRIKHDTFSMAEYFPASGAGAAPVTVAAHVDAWLKGHRIDDSTRSGYTSALNFWKTAVGDKSLRALKTGDLKQALADRPDFSGKTINNYVSVLREALDLAVIDKLMPSNPVEHVPRAKHQKPPIEPFDAAEVERILGAMTGQVANHTTFKFFTGLRTSEAFGLRWSNVDLASGQLIVREGVVAGKEKNSTKTSRVRTVFLNSRALAALKAQRELTFLADGHVFHDPRHGARWADEQAFTKGFWQPVLKRLQMRYRTPYNTRHTYATMMLMAGMTPAFCASQMGHSVDVFLRTYAKWIPGAGDKAEMAKLERTLSVIPALSLDK